MSTRPGKSVCPAPSIRSRSPAVALPDAAFYLWAGVPGGEREDSDLHFGRGLLAQYNVSVLPGSLLARSVGGARPSNPGTGRIRLALVAPVAECLEGAHRIVSYTESLR